MMKGNNMNMMKKALLFAMAVLASLCWAASPTATLLKNRASYNADIATAVKQGKWVANFAKAKKYATDNKVPLVAVWSNGDSCGHCTTFEGAVNSSTFKNYMKSSGVVFYFVYSGDKGNGTTSKSGSKADNGAIASSIFHWCRHNEITAYPFVRTYWPSGKVDTWTDGDKIDKKKSGTTGGKYAVDYFKAKLKKFKPTQPVVKPKYTGASFVVGDTETDRLEAEIGTTTQVELPFARTNLVVDTVSTNFVVISLPGNDTPATNRIDWASGDAETNLTVNIPGTMTSGEQIEIVLLDAAGKGVATSHVTAVEAPKNSPKNPLWVGEKTADELAWGEWTMDIDVATNKVNAYNAAKGTTTSGMRLTTPATDKDRAYTLLLLEGALWCPDCENTDKNLFDQEKFKSWATNNNVALVALDLSSADNPLSTAPCLLTTDKGLCYYAGAMASGASYLSRKMIDKDAAADILDRNWEIAQKLRLPSASKKNRPPVPAIIILRNDGTVAGRIEYFGNTESPTDASNIDAHIERLNELLRQVDDPVEEANDFAGTTTETIGLRASQADKTVSFADAADVYRLDPGTTANKRLSFALTGSDAASLQLTVVDGGEKVATATGLLTDGVSAGAAIKSTNAYVTVSYPTNETRFAVASSASTLCSYTLKTDFVVEPTELAADNRITIEDGVNEVTVALVSNQLYRITNLDTANEANLAALVPTNGPWTADGIYLAQVTEDVRLKLAASETEIQKWNPGTVGFSVSSASVLESAASYTIHLVRRGGTSGRATARVAFNAEKSSKYENLVELPDGFGDELVWEEGEADEKTLKLTIVENAFADGDQSLYFDVTVVGDAEPGIAQFRLSLRDNDKKVPGKIAITATTPAMAKEMTTFARAGSDVKLEMTRVDGTTGEQTVTLAASAGTLHGTSFTWANRVSAAEETQLTLPSETGKVKVTMTPEKGSFVDGKRRILTVNVLEADVPGFETDAKTIDATRYVPMAEVRIALDDKATDETKVKKYSGSLPQGVTWSFDKDAQEVVISGVPTQAGTFTAVFRAVTGKTKGLTLAVTVMVSDPVVKGGGENGTEPLNASVATSRTFADVPVFDEAARRLVGVFTLTVPRTGRLSAKYRSVDAGAVTLSCKSWSRIAADGTLTAELAGVAADGSDRTMVVDARPDGKLEVKFADFKVLLPGAAWSKNYPATDFKGYYTVSLPQKAVVDGTPRATGAGYATLKMNTAAAINAGKFAYAGVLPDGRAFSGSAVATPDAWLDKPSTSFWSRAVIPVVSLGKLDTFTGAFQVTPGAADAKATNMVDAVSDTCAGRCYYKAIRRAVAPAAEADLFWLHTEKAAEASYEVLLDAFGTYYVQTDNFQSCCQTTFQDTPLRFFVQDEGNDQDSAAWPTNGAPVITVKYTSKTKTNAITAAKNTRGLTFTFTPSTGIVSGTFKLDGEKMTYKGVVMPGWGSSDCTACGYSTGLDGGVEAQMRPFISGAAWFDDDVEYVDEKNRDQTISVRHGFPFTIGAQTGK